MNYCVECGNKIKQNQNYCPNCGKKIRKNSNQNNNNDNNVTKSDIKVAIDVIRYVIGGMISLSALLILPANNYRLTATFLLLCGLSIMPFFYDMLVKKNINKNQVLLLSILLPLFLFIVSMVFIPSSNNTKKHDKEIINKVDKVESEEEQIIKGIDKNISNTYKYKKPALKKTTNNKYIATLYLKRKDDNYNDSIWVGIDSIEIINSVKKYHKEDIDNKIEEYVINIYNYNDDNIYVGNIKNDYKEEAKEITIKNIKNNEVKKITKDQIDKYFKDQAAKAEAAKQAKEKEVKKKNSKVLHQVGETVICPHFEITLNRYQIKGKGTHIDSYQVISDPEWIGVILTVKNISDEEATFFTSDLRLQNSSGEIINPSFWNYNIWGAELLNSPKLISGGTKTGYVTFANTNQDHSNLKLRISCDDKIISKDTIYVYSLK